MFDRAIANARIVLATASNFYFLTLLGLHSIENLKYQGRNNEKSTDILGF
ncbi:MAG: hypothetical protein JGK08_11490 [Microcoleus sp. PH2017_04_SCI_O_A]|nr:hypothetical protein [Microcoleus sp. PH2017_04_SCI_O_A]